MLLTPQEQQTVLEEYGRNNFAKLRKAVDGIIAHYPKGTVINSQLDDYYSLASVVLWKLVERYDKEKCDDFYPYLIDCLKRKFITKCRNDNRNRRKANHHSVAVSLESEDTDGKILADKLASDFNIDRECFGDEFEFSDKMQLYLSKLSKKAQKLVYLMYEGYTKEEIMEQLHITSDKYNDYIKLMRSYEMESILF